MLAKVISNQIRIILRGRCRRGWIHGSLQFIHIKQRRRGFSHFSIVYSFIEITSDIPHMFTIKVQVIRNTAHRPSTQASYTIGSGTTMQEIQKAAQIAAKHSIIPQMAPYMS